MNNSFAAAILAAGYGTRLSPVTDIVPKPLIPLGDRTLLENIMLNLRNAGVAKFAVNTHHRGELIERCVESSDWKESVELFRENEILGTGGPLVNAKSLLGNYRGFILHNGDILTDINLQTLIETHKADSDTLVTLVMIEGPENRVAVNERGRVVDILGRLGIQSSSHRLMTYAGIACFSQEIFKYLPDKLERASIIEAILKLMQECPEKVAAYIPEENGQKNYYWNDLGTVAKFAETFRRVVSGEILLPLLQETLKSIPMPLEPLKQQGSDRLFFRINEICYSPGVLMCAAADTTDFDRFIKIGCALDYLNLGVPKIYSVSTEKHTIIMEDLGNNTLFELCRKDDRTEIESLYRKVIEWLVHFQTSTYEYIVEEGYEKKATDIPLRKFDYDYLRWETSYFRENFLEKYCGLKDIPEGLNDEFDRLARKCFSHPQLMIHRDFQSQNILIKDNEVRIVDFQGARLGHIAYDLMSLVNDPYVNMGVKLRKSLITYYFERLKGTVFAEKIPETTEMLYLSAGLQRIMQALGAFSFLSMVKGKKEYCKYIPSALETLENELEQIPAEYPILRKIVKISKKSLCLFANNACEYKIQAL